MAFLKRKKDKRRGRGGKEKGGWEEEFCRDGVWPAKPKLFTAWHLTDEACRPLLGPSLKLEPSSLNSLDTAHGSGGAESTSSGANTAAGLNEGFPLWQAFRFIKPNFLEFTL